MEVKPASLTGTTRSASSTKVDLDAAMARLTTHLEEDVHAEIKRGTNDCIMLINECTRFVALLTVGIMLITLGRVNLIGWVAIIIGTIIPLITRRDDFRAMIEKRIRMGILREDTDQIMGNIRKAR